MNTKRPKVLLVVLPYLVQTSATGAKIRSYHAFPYGVLSMATYNQRCNDIEILDLNAIKGDETVIGTFNLKLRDFKPHIVGFSMMFDNSYKFLGNLLQVVKNYDAGIITLLGGAAAFYSAREIIDEQPMLDAICFGEGEQPLRDLLNSPYPMEWLKEHPSWIMRNKIPMPHTYNIAIDPLIDLNYDFVNVNDYKMKQAFSPGIGSHDMRQFFVMTSRGCPFKCTFCSNSVIHGRKIRYAKPETILAHVDDLVKWYGMEVLTFYDDQILLDMDRAKEIFRGLAKYHIRVECPNGLSVAYIDEEMAYLMREAGMDTVYLAIESGSPDVLKAMNKPLKLEQVKPVVDILREYGFYIHGFFVMGMPGETEKNRVETRDFLDFIDLDWAGLNMATPVRGSELYQQCLENGWIEKQRIEDIVDKKYIINIPGTDPAAIEEDVYKMNLDVNFVHNRRMRKRDWLTAARSFEEVIERYPDHAFAYYYLSQCKNKLFNIGRAELGKFHDICATNKIWKKRATELIHDIRGAL